MYKASIELFKIGKNLKVKFGLVIKGDTKQEYQNKIINRFNFNGNEFVKINPNPFITLDISDMNTKTEGWCTNNFVNLNRYGLFRFIVNLKKLINDINDPENRDLFYYNNEYKILNKEIALNCRKTFRVSPDKVITLEPSVVYDNGTEYEGCILCINSYSFYTYLTLEEMEYLYNELTKIDINSLSLNLLNLLETQKINENKNNKTDIEVTSITKPLSEEINEKDDKDLYVPIKDTSLPNI